MANEIKVADTKAQQVAVKINNELTAIMGKSENWQLFMRQLPKTRQQQIANDVYNYINLHTDTVAKFDTNEFMARVIDCYSQGYTLVDGDAFIVPYWNKAEKRFVATLVPGYLGIKRKAMETGMFKYFTVSHVYKESIKGYDYRREVPIFNEEYIPNGTETLIGYLGYYEMFSGSIQEIYCSIEKLKEHAIKYSQQSKKEEDLAGLWKDSTDAMCLKTMYRKLGKLAPKSKNPTLAQSQFFDYIDNDDNELLMSPETYENTDLMADDLSETQVIEQVSETTKNPVKTPNTSELKCSECGSVITATVYDYSVEKYGKALCYNCQKKHKKG